MWGWEAEYSNESRFLGEYPCGGHAGLGHHRRAVGDQDLLRRVEQAGATVGDKKPQILERFAIEAPFRGGGRPPVFFWGAKIMRLARSINFYRPASSDPASIRNLA